MKKKIDVAIVGASGFTGGEICRILLNHKNINNIYPFSREKKFFKIAHPHLSNSGLKFFNLKKISNYNFDVIFLCTKSKDSEKLAELFFKRKVKIIDLSGAFRFKTQKKFTDAYGYNNKSYLNKKAVYGLTEYNRKNIKNAKIISNPGCYAITALLSLGPIIKKNFLENNNRLSIHSLNGTTGAGNNPKTEIFHSKANENILTYNADGHRHSSEIEEKLKIFFNKDISIDLNTAHGSFRRGIYMQICLYVKKNFINKISREKILKIYKKYFIKEKFIIINDLQKIEKKNEKEYSLYPYISSVVGSNNCLIGIDYDKMRGVIKIISCTDNLTKGAAGSAIQNMNLIFGFNEIESLPNFGIFN